MEHTSQTKPKQWIMNAFAMSTPGHLATGLRHPRNRTSEYINIEYWTDLAKLLEAGNFHGLLIADVMAFIRVLVTLTRAYREQPSFQFLTHPMAAVTDHLSFGITASTTYENPFLLARRFATLDHLTKGRVAWNVVTSHLESAAKNLGLPTQIEHDKRYEIAEKHLAVTYKLWESPWRDDAVVKDNETKQYTAPGRVRTIDHEGKYFKSAGPLTTEPSIQRTPFIFQAGESSAGKDFATKHAECMFLPGMEPQAVRKMADGIRKKAVDNGRDPSRIKLISGIVIIVDETDEKAQTKYEDYLSYADIEGTLTLFGGWTGVDLDKWDDDEDFPRHGQLQYQELSVGGAHARAIGSPKTVADILQRWVDEAGIDGFNISYAINPADFEDINKWLLPELRARGVFWDGYVASTTRENCFNDGLGPRLRDDHTGAK